MKFPRFSVRQLLRRTSCKAIGTLVLVLLVLTTFFASVFVDRNLYIRTTARQSLTRRQQNILAQMNPGLQQLTEQQKYAVTQSDLMLQYLEKKYEIPFSYAGFSSAIAEGGGEKLFAYPAGKDPLLDVCTVTKVDTGSELRFEDDYGLVEKRKEYQDLILQALRNGGMPEEGWSAFFNLTKTDRYLPKSDQRLAGHSEGEGFIFLNLDLLTPEQLSMSIEIIKETFNRLRLAGRFAICPMESQEYNRTTIFTAKAQAGKCRDAMILELKTDRTNVKEKKTGNIAAIRPKRQ